VPLYRILALNAREWWLIILGILAALLQGSIFPLFAIFFGNILSAFYQPRDQVLSAVTLPALLFLILAIVAAVIVFVKVCCCLLLLLLFVVVYRLLRLLFLVNSSLLGLDLYHSKLCSDKSVTCCSLLLFVVVYLFLICCCCLQELGWYDDERNSTGALTTRLAEDAALVQGATGSRLAQLIETLFTMLLALGIALGHSWIMTFVILGFAPFLVIVGVIRALTFKQYLTRNKSSLSEAGKNVVDSLENIRTVTSLNLQVKFVSIYENELKKPYK
jgi:ABC-type multidrug transport system fused ATPase/permease subunit